MSNMDQITLSVLKPIMSNTDKPKKNQVTLLIRHNAFFSVRPNELTLDQTILILEGLEDCKHSGKKKKMLITINIFCPFTDKLGHFQK